MHSTAYLILFVDAEGVIVDAQVASEYPVTQMLDGRTQALINQRSGVSYDHACVSLLDYAALNVSWVFKHKRLRKQAEDMMRFADSKDRSIRCAKDWHNVRRVLQG